MIVSGEVVWKAHATHGVPIEMTLMLMSKRGLVPDWYGLLEAASRDGASMKTLIPRLQQAVRDAYDKDFSAVVCGRLENL